MKTPVSDLEAEAAVLSCMMIDPRLTAQIGVRLKKDDFYHQRNRLIFAAMVESYEKNQAIDSLLIADELARQGSIEAAGGPSYITRLIGAAPSTLNWMKYVDLVSKLGRQRRIQAVLEESATSLYTRESDPDEVALDVQTRMADASAGRHTVDFKSMTDASIIFNREFEQRQEAGGTPYHPTGLEPVDEILGGGVYPGRTYWVAGLSKMGKTKFTASLVRGIMQERLEQVRREHRAERVDRQRGGEDTEGLFARMKREGFACDWYTAEMTVTDMYIRLLSSQMGFPEDVIRDGKKDGVPLKDIEGFSRRLEDASNELLRLDIRWYFEAAPKLSDIVLNTRERLHQLGHDRLLVVVDYIQRLDAGHRGDGAEYRNITDSSKMLSGLSKELGFTGIFVSHFNRAGANRSIPRPNNLRGSGQIEQDVDHLLIVHRPDWECTDGREEYMLCWHALSRHNQGGRANLRAKLGVNRFSRWDAPVPDMEF